MTAPCKITLNVNGKASTVNVDDAHLLQDLTAWRGGKTRRKAARRQAHCRGKQLPDRPKKTVGHAKR